jgi:hypothetical protein
MCGNHIFQASPKKCENSPNKKEKEKASRYFISIISVLEDDEDPN